MQVAKLNSPRVNPTYRLRWSHDLHGQSDIEKLDIPEAAIVRGLNNEIDSMSSTSNFLSIELTTPPGKGHLDLRLHPTILRYWLDVHNILYDRQLSRYKDGCAWLWKSFGYKDPVPVLPARQ